MTTQTVSAIMLGLAWTAFIGYLIKDTVLHVREMTGLYPCYGGSMGNGYVIWHSGGKLAVLGLLSLWGSFKLHEMIF